MMLQKEKDAMDECERWPLNLEQSDVSWNRHIHSKVQPLGGWVSNYSPGIAYRCCKLSAAATSSQQQQKAHLRAPWLNSGKFSFTSHGVPWVQTKYQWCGNSCCVWLVQRTRQNGKQFHIKPEPRSTKKWLPEGSHKSWRNSSDAHQWVKLEHCSVSVFWVIDYFYVVLICANAIEQTCCTPVLCDSEWVSAAFT